MERKKFGVLALVVFIAVAALFGGTAALLQFNDIKKQLSEEQQARRGLEEKVSTLQNQEPSEAELKTDCSVDCGLPVVSLRRISDEQTGKFMTERIAEPFVDWHKSKGNTDIVAIIVEPGSEKGEFLLDAIHKNGGYEGYLMEEGQFMQNGYFIPNCADMMAADDVCSVPKSFADKYPEIMKAFYELPYEVRIEG